MEERENAGKSRLFLVGGAGEKRRKEETGHVYGLFRRTVQGRFLGKEKQLIKRMSKVETPNFYQLCWKVCDFMFEAVSVPPRKISSNVLFAR